MKKVIEIVSSTGTLKFTVEKETKENVFIVERSLLNKKLRFSKKENRLENMINGKWDVYITDDCVYGFNVYEVEESVESIPCDAMNDADNTPQMMPMPGTEDPNWGVKAAGVEEDITPDRMTGNDIIEHLSESLKVPVKKTRKGELWISLDMNQFAMVLDYLIHNVDTKHMRWETKRGSLKSRIWDEDNGTELVFKKYKADGSGAYLWCTKD